MLTHYAKGTLLRISALLELLIKLLIPTAPSQYSCIVAYILYLALEGRLPRYFQTATRGLNRRLA
jgi:hypothetical protein